jgi:hypothetical protein
MCTIISKSERWSVERADDVARLIRELAAIGINNFIVEKAAHLYLTVCMNNVHIVVVYGDYRGDRADRTMPSASIETKESPKRVKFIVGNEPTPIPANMCLSWATGIAVIEDFCFGQELSPRVHWIKDRPPGKKSGRAIL